MVKLKHGRNRFDTFHRGGRHTFLCYVFVIVGQKNLRPTVAGMYNYVQPVVACIVAICWGMDTFNWVKGLSVLLIFGGVYMVTRSRSRAEMEAHEKEMGK